MFRAPAMLLPHESTVAHEQRFIMDAPMISRTRSRVAIVGGASNLVEKQPVEEYKDLQVRYINVMFFLHFLYFKLISYTHHL